MNDRNGFPPAFGVALQVLGASAGIVGFLTFVGGTLLWLRFSELHLPADQSVARLSPGRNPEVWVRRWRNVISSFPFPRKSGR